MANPCSPPICSDSFEEGCEALDCVFDVNRLNIDKLFGRTDDLCAAVTDIDGRVSSIEESITVNESPFMFVDTEAQLDEGLLAGKSLVLRGDGNGGIIPISSFKNVSVDKTKFIDGGGVLKGNFSVVNPIGVGFAPVMFNVQANDVAFEGVSFLGKDALDGVYESYSCISIDPGFAVKRLKATKCHFKNVYRALSKWGYVGCQRTQGVTFKDNFIENVTNFAVGIQQGIWDSDISGNKFILHPDGAFKIFTNAQGIWISADAQRVNIDSNKVRNGIRNGIELTTTAESFAIVQPMRKIIITNNIVESVGTIGISNTYNEDGVIAGNIVDGFTGIGIESANGSSPDEVITNTNNLVASNIVRNGRNTDGNYVTGISVDQSVNDKVVGNEVTGLSSTYSGPNPPWGYCRGLLIYRGKRASVKSNSFVDVDGVGVFVQPAHLAPSTMMVMIENNDFYISPDMTKAGYAVMVQASRAVVRNNTAWAPTAGPGTQYFYFQFNSSTTINSGDQGEIVSTDGEFNDSNLKLLY